MYDKKDGRLSISFDDDGYVSNTDLFLTGCISGLPLCFAIDGSTCDKKLLYCPKKFKTMLHFYEGKIKCQGLLYKEIEGYLRHRFLWKEIKTFCVPGGADDKQELIDFLKL